MSKLSIGKRSLPTKVRVLFDSRGVELEDDLLRHVISLVDSDGVKFPIQLDSDNKSSRIVKYRTSSEDHKPVTTQINIGNGRTYLEIVSHTEATYKGPQFWNCTDYEDDIIEIRNSNGKLRIGNVRNRTGYKDVEFPSDFGEDYMEFKQGGSCRKRIIEYAKQRLELAVGSRPS